MSTDIKALTRKLPAFKSYYRGVKTVNLALPNNVLVFTRYSREDLAGNAARFHHNRFVLVINLQTHGCINIDGNILNVREREAVLIFPFQFHSFLNLEQEKLCWLIVTFELDQPDIIESLRNTVLMTSQTFLESARALLHMATRNSFTFEKPDNRFVLQAGLLLEELVMIHKQSQSRKTSLKLKKSEDVLFLEKVNAVIWEKIDEPKSVEQVASRVGYSESHLRNLFRKKVGMSLGNYLRRIYIQRAASLIHHSEKNISEISEQCGFSSIYAFSRMFKSQMGLSPLAYRASIEKNKFK